MTNLFMKTRLFSDLKSFLAAAIYNSYLVVKSVVRQGEHFINLPPWKGGNPRPNTAPMSPST